MPIPPTSSTSPSPRQGCPTALPTERATDPTDRTQQPPRRPGLRLIALLSAVVTLVLVATGCESDASPRLHDVFLYDAAPQRVSYLFGEPGVVADPFETDATLELEPIEPGGPVMQAEEPGLPPVVPSALAIDGAPYLTGSTDPVDAPFTVERIPLTTDLQLRTTAPLPLLLYFDGESWLTLATDARPGLGARVAPRPRVGRLRGAGAFTDAEADAWADAIETQGEPVVVAVLRESALPDRTPVGVSEYRRTGLLLQRDLPIDGAAFRPPPEEVVWQRVARGFQATAVEETTFRLIRDPATLATVWSRAHAGVLESPPLPEANFGREALVAIFMGSRPTGGYSIEIESVTLEDGDVYVDLRFLEPGPDAVVTQALTSPWSMLRVLRRDVDVVWFRDPDDGRLLGVARQTE